MVFFNMEKEKVIIRSATPADFKSVQALQLIDGLTADLNAWSDESLNNYLAGNLFFVAYDSDKFLGYILGERLLGDGAMIWFCEIMPEYRNGVAAKLLIDKFEATCKAVGITWTIAFTVQKLANVYKHFGAFTGEKYTEVLIDLPHENNMPSLPDGITVRPAVETDFSVIQVLQHAELPDADGGFWGDELLRDFVARGILLVAEYRGQFAGYVAGEYLLDGGVMAWHWAVGAECRGMGVGEILHNALLDTASKHGASWVFLYSVPKMVEFHRARGATIGLQYTEVLKDLALGG